MANDKVCVGGIDLDKSISVRLLDRNGYHESKDDCSYHIRDIWDIEYIPAPRQLPHSEDIKVICKTKSATLKQECSILDILKKVNFKIYFGSIRNTFEGKLYSTKSGSLYISGDIPENSTCFWICDKQVYRRDFNEKVRYNYTDGTRQGGYYISYVGLDTNPAWAIPAGTLIRLSLAHWWSPQDSEDEERCYLQLSGWYVSS
jgi:hypothetical protein